MSALLSAAAHTTSLSVSSRQAAGRNRTGPQPVVLASTFQHHQRHQQRQHAAHTRSGRTAIAAASAAAADAPPAAPSQQPAATTNRSSRTPPADSSSNKFVAVRIGADTVPLKLARFLLGRFQEQGPEFTAVLQSVGPVAALQSLKALARLQQMVSEQGPEGACVIFKPQVFRAELSEEQQQQQEDGSAGASGGASSDSGGGGGSIDATGPRRLSALKIVVTLGSKGDWPADAFAAGSDSGSTPAAGDGADKKAAADERSTSSSSSSSSSSSQSGRQSTLRPTAVRPDNKDEQARLYTHAVRSTERQVPAAYTIQGTKTKASQAALMFFKALSAARKAVHGAEPPVDLQCTLSSTASTRTYTNTSRPDGGADGSSRSSESSREGEGGDADGPPTTFTVVRYMLAVQRCEPNRRQVEAAARRKAYADGSGSSSSGSGSSSSSAGRRSDSRAAAQTRPGFVEVCEEEWLALKEQLAVVPHLTEQLQIMTRQHEQLLSLLAAQQQTQTQQPGQEEGGGTSSA